MTEKFEKLTKVRLPFDRRNPDPKINYGIHATDIWFILKGPKGAIQFGVTLPCYLPHVQAELEAKPDTWGRNKIRGFDVGYHALEPQYEGQHEMDECDLFPGSKCFYDGSSLRADEWVEDIFSVRGEPPETLLWKMLEEEYELRFGDKPASAIEAKGMK